MSEPTFLETVKRTIVLFDGAMGSLLEARNLSEEDYRGKSGCCEILNLTRPDVIEEIHRSYFEAGADTVETNTFQGSRLKLEEHGFGAETRAINSRAAQIARKAADACAGPGRPRFVIGSIGPTGRLASSGVPALSISVKELKEVFSEQAAALIEGGVDALLLETQQDILETRAAVFGIRDAFAETGRRVPILAFVTVDKNGNMLTGTSIEAAITILEPLGVDAIGINCSLGPEEMREFAWRLSENCSVFTGCMPNAGLPENLDGVPRYALSPASMAESLAEFALSYGIDIVGGCCGTTPAHIREIRRLVGQEKPARQHVKRVPAVASAFRSVPLRQEPRPLLIGERLNILGSKKTKDLVQNRDLAGLVRLAAEQEALGCHLLDVCMAGEREKDRMREAVRLLSHSVEAPLVIDTTDEDVIRTALEIYPGRALVNSVNLEKGKENLVKKLLLIKEYGATAVAMTITEAGMALRAEEKLEAVAGIKTIALDECTFPAEDLLFDCLTFPLSTGEEKYADSASETLVGIRRIKKAFPGTLTILGVSNISFGLMPEARKFLNSVFLYHAIQAGLDAAIVNARDIVPYSEIPAREKELCENLIFNRGETALRDLIEWFQKERRETNVEKEKRGEPSLEAAIRSRIIDRSEEGLKELLEKALEEKSAQRIINEVLLPGMEEVGKRFDSGEMLLPFVLQSAGIMSKAIAYLDAHLAGKPSPKRGTILLATVFGDVHDIGKNLVKAILANSGYSVLDLGRQVPVQDIVQRAREEHVDAIGLSALLVSTSREMGACVRELSRSHMEIPVLIGGAAVNDAFARRIALLESGSPYPGGVFYAKDAFQGLDILNSLMEDRRSRIEIYRKEMSRSLEQGPRLESRPSPEAPFISIEHPLRPPFLGRKSIPGIPLREIFPLLDLDSLFRSRWAAKAKDSAELREKEFLPALDLLKRESVERHYFDLSAVYGYFFCRAEGEMLGIESEGREFGFHFSRESFVPRSFLSQRQADVVALGIVTAGGKAAELERELIAQGDLQKAFYLHGLSAEMAEGLADYLESIMRRELNVPEGSGKRVSPGFPSWPELSEQRTLFSLLRPEEFMSIALTESFQMVPEHSVSFLFCPRAKAPRA